MARYKIISCHVFWRELCHLAAQSTNIFDFQFLKQGLHDTPDQLRLELQAAIDAAEAANQALKPKQRFSAFLLGYGLCSNGIAGIVARTTPLVLIRGHDCITHLLGSRARYREYFDSHPGTYWYSPGWIDTGSQPGQDRYETTLQAYVKKYGEANAAYLMEMEQGWFKAYTNATYIDLGFGGSEQGKEYTQTCAKWLGWKYDELKGDAKLLEQFLAGRWESEDFLVVKPGQTIVPSYDDLVVRAEDPTPAG